MCPEATSSAQRGRENSVQLEVKGARLWARSRWRSGLREEAAPGLPVRRAHSVPSQNHQRDSPAHLCPQPWWHSWAVVGSNGKDLVVGSNGKDLVVGSNGQRPSALAGCPGVFTYGLQATQALPGGPDLGGCACPREQL